ncbi:MAG: beta-hydroxyacyl-ACP dehydratase [Gemmatales bacterium]|nr:MAG: beta-hydroxyacyl-ACP dehydratase [Gemmatales bacterium]
MRFNLLDRITAMTAGKSVQAVKNLTLGEEYLADHFPTFPVMPGVLMLQTLVEAGSWLLRVTNDFRHSLVVLREAKNVKYGTFMEPGRQMHITVDLLAQEESGLATLKGKGEVGGQTTVSARLVLFQYNLKDTRPECASVDQRLIDHLRDVYAFLTSANPVGIGS